ncbi:S8 family serine peptidase [Cystobacter fuscus]|uniref:S8 family serine peptidase n=1 Tax=Cystobacter fuscus TaxID=43 RepID=UPI0037C08C94
MAVWRVRFLEARGAPTAQRLPAEQVGRSLVTRGDAGCAPRPVMRLIQNKRRASHREKGPGASLLFTEALPGDSIDIGTSGANDCNGHGTHVAGTAGGSQWGVAKNVRLHAVRVLGCDGKGSTSGVIAGVDWVTANHVKPAVANMSLGGDASRTGTTTTSVCPTTARCSWSGRGVARSAERSASSGSRPRIPTPGTTTISVTEGGAPRWVQGPALPGPGLCRS